MTSIAIDRLDGLSSATAIKGPVRVATTANITLSGTQTIDGVAVVADDRVLVKNQTTGSENGIYVVATGAWRRAKDFSRNNDVRKGTQILVTDGTVSADSGYYVDTDNPITIGTTSIVFTRNILNNADAVALAALQLLQATGELDPVLLEQVQPLGSVLRPWQYLRRNRSFPRQRKSGCGTVTQRKHNLRGCTGAERSEECLEVAAAAREGHGYPHGHGRGR